MSRRRQRRFRGAAVGFVSKHPWMTFFLASSVIGAVATVVARVVAPASFRGYGRYGMTDLVDYNADDSTTPSSGTVSVEIGDPVILNRETPYGPSIEDAFGPGGIPKQTTPGTPYGPSIVDAFGPGGIPQPMDPKAKMLLVGGVLVLGGIALYASNA